MREEIVRQSLALLAALGFLAACSTDPQPPTDSAPSSAPPVGQEPARDTDPAPTTDKEPSAATPPGWGPSACVAPTGATGFEIGDSLADLGLMDCETGASTTMDDVCGASATWVFAAHTHCPTCQSTASFTDDVAKAVADKNVAIVQTVYDDDGTSCAKWRSVYKLAGISNVRVYADPKGAVFQKLKSSSYTAASAFLNGERVIVHKEHNLTKAEVLAQIETTLGKN